MKFMKVGNGINSAGNIAKNTFAAPINPPTAAAWVRNPSWPTLAGPSTSENKIVGLFAVFPNQPNFFAVNITTSSGQYTVDYGDGSATVNTNSGAQLNYSYSYSSAGLANTDAPVTLQQSGNLVLRNSHGYTNGATVSFYNIVTTTGLTTGQIYYVINSSANQFQVSDTPGGSAVTLTNNGSATLLPYKIATVTITPTTGGSNFTTINTSPKHNQSGLTSGYCNGWLEIKLNSTSSLASVVTVSGNTTASCSRMLENVEARHCMTIGSSFLGATAINLRRAVLTFTNTSNFSIGAIFSTCYKLTEVTITLEGAGKPNSTNATFTGCYSLQTAPMFDTSAVTTTTQMFNNNYSLVTVPFYNTSAATNTQQMFQNCYSLQTVPPLDVSSSTVTNLMLSGARSFKTLPLFKMNSGASFTAAGMFIGCFPMTRIPLLNMATCTDFGNFFANCYSLVKVPLLNTSAATVITSMFSNCGSIKTVPQFNFSAAISVNSVFATCYSLVSVPVFSIKTTGTVNMEGMFNGCWSIQSIPLFNTTAVTNMGSMFQNCYSLPTIPLLTTSAVTNMSNIFSGCSALQIIPLLNTAAATSVQSMFQNCVSLREVPALNFSAVQNSISLNTIVNGAFLNRIPITGAKFTHSIASQCLNSTNLDEYYTGLPTVTGQTLTVTGNYGSPGTTSIATNKGWAVTT